MRAEQTSARPGADGPAADPVIEGWARLLTWLVVVIVAGFAVVLPFAGLLLALAAAAYLHAGDSYARRHDGGLLRMLAGPLNSPLDLARGTAYALLTLPYAAVFAVLVPMAVMAGAAVHVEVAPLVGAGWGAGAAAGALLAAPGVRAPRRQLIGLFTSVAKEPNRIALAGVVLCVLALVSVAGAIVLQPRLAPMYELKNSIVQSLSHFQQSVRRHVP
jgi:hypothetical protein